MTLLSYAHISNKVGIVELPELIAPGRKAKASVSGIPGQCGLHSKALSQKSDKTREMAQGCIQTVSDAHYLGPPHSCCLCPRANPEFLAVAFRGPCTCSLNSYPRTLSFSCITTFFYFLASFLNKL